jgi:hypothetical protein
MKDPIIICGAHGGGTSFIVKILRYAGFFGGSDCGALSDRKVHESKIMKRLNRGLIKRMNVTGKYESGRTNVVIKEYEKFVESGRKEELVQWLFLNYTQTIQKNIWGDSVQERAWGWKDPRNSITSLLWKEIYPEAKYLIICKKRDGKKSKSNSGKWFKETASDEVLHFYMNPPVLNEIDPKKVKHLQFEKMISDWEYFNDILQWCGLSFRLESENSLQEYMKNVSLEK